MVPFAEMPTKVLNMSRMEPTTLMAFVATDTGSVESAFINNSSEFDFSEVVRPPPEQGSHLHGSCSNAPI